ncbi:MAG: arylesterase [Vicinamibacterales bacterium]
MAGLSRSIPHLAFALTALLLAGACRGSTPQNPQPSAGADAAAAPTPSTSESGEPSRPRIVMLGDSLTAGLGLLESQAFPALIQQKIDAEGYTFEVVNAGVSGDTSAGGLRRLDWALEGDVKVMVIALGANDGLRGLSVEEMKNNISQIIDRARDRGVLCILAGMEAPPNFGPEYTTAFRQAFRDIAVKHRLLLLPFLLNNVAGQAALNQGDGVHPNQQGAAIVAENVWRVLRPVLDQLPATQ